MQVPLVAQATEQHRMLIVKIVIITQKRNLESSANHAKKIVHAREQNTVQTQSWRFPFSTYDCISIHFDAQVAQCTEQVL